MGLRCESDADVDATIKRANEINDQPVVVDFTVSKDAMVWPMVAAGVSNDEIQYARGVAPESSDSVRLSMKKTQSAQITQTYLCPYALSKSQNII